MHQLSFGEKPPEPTPRPPMRPYQEQAHAAILEQLAVHRSTQLVMATGTGKTFNFSALAHDWPGRVLICAHRDFLLEQARDRLAEMTGERVGLEQGSFYAGDERIVVASVPTLSRKDRLRRWPRNTFSLVVIDESHHHMAPTYLRVLEHFDKAKVLGVTATPKPTKIFNSTAFVYDTLDAITDGWLVDPVPRKPMVKAINLTKVHTVDGDFDQRELDAAMQVEEAMLGVARILLEQAEWRKTLVFTPSVGYSKRMVEILNRPGYRPGCARHIDGKTPTEERKALFAGFARGDFQFLCNCNIATEGYNCPEIECIGLCRPTKSWYLFCQMVGRGLRIAPGKKNCLILEFTGNFGRHTLSVRSTIDALGAKFTPAEVKRAKHIAARDPSKTASEALLQARAEEAARHAAEVARRAKLAADVDYSMLEIDPFRVLHIGERKVAEAERCDAKPPSDKQVRALRAFGVDIPTNCTFQLARTLLNTCFARKARGLATYDQVKYLGDRGIQAINMGQSTAARLVGVIRSRGGATPPESLVRQITGR